uniref:uncharacterized protein si:ch211-14c7.2 isoform X2 n=1 Tax=Scatophagus argus TaxID=75038 RepID=UPI001ED83B3E|nr:uncharacterized protein si:ch211-14c7.2 isoform X2 [Scatophagus argus]
MRPTTSTMLQQNNNNNYPCLNVSGSTREILQKCSRASLPLPSRLELGLGDLPLIRGLRAWALCSKNRRKAGGLLGGGQAPTAPPAGRGGSTSCPRPADVYLSREWGRLGYGLPLGLDAGQAGIGALVTVATLKTSEGSGKTQTQCLFLRTEKGSCLYSTAKPGSGVTTSAASGVVGGWLRGKTGGGGGGCRDTPAGRRDHGLTPPTQSGANRVRVRSGRRWRKSCNAAGREKAGVSRERQQQSNREDPAREIALGERQEDRDKGGLDGKQFPSPQQDIRRARQEKEGALRSARCCHNISPKACTQCGRRARRRESQDEHQGGESPNNRLNCEAKGMKKEMQKNEEEEEKRDLCELETSDSVLAAQSPDLESNHSHSESHSGRDVEEIKEAESNEGMKTQTSHSKDDCSEEEEDTNSEVMKIHTDSDPLCGRSEQVMDDFWTGQNDRKSSENSREEIAACVEANQESEKVMEGVDVKEEEGNISQAPAGFSLESSRCEDISVSTCPAPTSTAVSPESSAPIEGSTHNADHENCGALRENSKEDHLKWYQQIVSDCGVMGKEEPDVGRFEQLELNCVADESNTVNESRKPLFSFKNVDDSGLPDERDASSSPLRHDDPSIFEADGRIVTARGCSYSGLNVAEWRDEAGELWRRERTGNEPDGGDFKDGDDKERHAEDDTNDGAIQDDDDKEVRQHCALKVNWRSEERAGGCWGWKDEVGDTSGQTSITHVGAERETSTNAACADPSTSLALSLANSAPSPSLLESMATSLPCVEVVEEEEEEEGVGVTAGDREGGQEGDRRPGRELEELSEERSSTLDTQEGRKEEEEEEEDDEFGVFMQAEGEPSWSQGSTVSASVPCGSRASVALGNHAISGESIHWTPGWTDSSFHQSDDAWTAFPQDSSGDPRDVVGQWWPTSAVEESRGRLLTNQNLTTVFAEAFPSSPGSSSRDAVPTLTQFLRGTASQDQGLLDSFHDLNKMICQRYKRANGVSRDLLLKTLHLEQPHTENRPASRIANRRLSPGLPSANQHAQNAAAKRRLSYDYNRNIME